MNKGENEKIFQNSTERSSETTTENMNSQNSIENVAKMTHLRIQIHLTTLPNPLMNIPTIPVCEMCYQSQSQILDAVFELNEILVPITD